MKTMLLNLFDALSQRSERVIARYGVHLSLMAGVIAMSLVGGGTVLSRAEPPRSTPVVTPQVIPTPHATPTPDPEAFVLARKALPQTSIPDRSRGEIISYTVQEGDTIFSIAQKFGLSPETIVWANREVLQDAPWLIEPGLSLFILPEDGVYHVVQEGDTLFGIALRYKVPLKALYNYWNDVAPDKPLQVGQLLFVPGGKGPEVAWVPTPPPSTGSYRPGVGSAAASYGACGAVNVVGPGANGYFILPTGSRYVSGWTFHDPRNPTHIGLDYGLKLGDPIYAADNGVVIFAGWGGGYGNLVKINHGNGYVTYYAHLDQIWVGCGDAVYQGQVIGLGGTTGYSTGPHLHYEIRYNGVPQDPRLYEP